MKKLKTFFAIGFTALLVSCGGAKDTASKSATQNRGRVNQEVSANKKTPATGSRISNAEKSADIAVNREAEALQRANMQRMYSDLNMSKNQVSRFEGEWKKTQNSWKRDNPNQLMNNYETIENQDSILNDILDDNQFESYRQWVLDNPIED